MVSKIFGVLDGVFGLWFLCYHREIILVDGNVIFILYTLLHFFREMYMRQIKVFKSSYIN